MHKRLCSVAKRFHTVPSLPLPVSSQPLSPETQYMRVSNQMIMSVH